MLFFLGDRDLIRSIRSTGRALEDGGPSGGRTGRAAGPGAEIYDCDIIYVIYIVIDVICADG